MGLSHGEWCTEPPREAQHRSRLPGALALLILAASLAFGSLAFTTLTGGLGPASAAAPRMLTPMGSTSEEIRVEGDSVVVLQHREFQVSSIVVEDQGSLTIRSSKLTISGSVTVLGQATLLIEDSTIEAGGPFVLSGSSVLYVSDSDIGYVTLSGEASATFVDSRVQDLTVLEGSQAHMVGSSIGGVIYESRVLSSSFIIRYEEAAETTVVLNRKPSQ